MITPLDGIRRRAAQLGANVTYDDGSDTARAAAAAAAADVAVVVVGTTSSEGADRPTLALPDAENALVSAVGGAAQASVAVLAVPGAVLTPWSDKVHAILVPWLSGQAGE